MPPDTKDMARLWDILDSGRAILSFINGRPFQEFLNDRMLRNAVERNLEIIGEAARRLSQSTRENNPDIPWTAIIGLRNVIAHEYGELRHEKIWRICINRLSERIEQIERMEVDRAP